MPKKKPKKPKPKSSRSETDSGSSTLSSELLAPTAKAPAGETLDEIAGDVKRTAETGDVERSEKRGPGRPKGSKAKPKAPEAEGTIPDVAALSASVRLLFGLAATRGGNHWNLLKKDADGWAEQANAVMVKYNATVGAELALALSTLALVGGRIYLTMELRRQAEEKKAAGPTPAEFPRGNVPEFGPEKPTDGIPS